MNNIDVRKYIINNFKEDSVEESEEPVNDGEKESEVTDSKLDLEQAITSKDLTGNKEETQEAESTTEGPDKEESDEQKKDLDVSKECSNKLNEVSEKVNKILNENGELEDFEIKE